MRTTCGGAAALLERYDEAVMVCSRATAQREGRTLDIDQINLYRFNEEGKNFEGRAIPVDLCAYDSLWT